MNYIKLTEKRAKQIARESNGAFDFKFVDGTLKGVRIRVEGFDINFEYTDYSVVGLEIVAETVYKVGFQTQVAKEVTFMERAFDTKKERDQFVEYNLSDEERNSVSLWEEQKTEPLGVFQAV